MNYKRELPFSIVPVEVAFDSRLNFRHVRVLIALLSFRNRNTGLMCPSRKMISARCQLPLDRISLITTELVKLGWITKSGNGGKSSSCCYVLTVPDFVTEQLSHSIFSDDENMLTDSVTGTPNKNGEVPLSEKVGGCLSDLVGGKEQTIEQTIELTKEKYKKEKFSDDEILKKYGVTDPVLVADFVQHRKQHKAAITETALQGLHREGLKAGLSLVEVLRECIERNWRGFKAEWLNNSTGGKHANSIRNTRKLSLVEQYDIDVERVQQREQRERERFTVVAG